MVVGADAGEGSHAIQYAVLFVAALYLVCRSNSRHTKTFQILCARPLPRQKDISVGILTTTKVESVDPTRERFKDFDFFFQSTKSISRYSRTVGIHSTSLVLVGKIQQPHQFY